LALVFFAGTISFRIAPMSWHNVKLIFFREVRDQLRDRRTLFMIAVLPLLLYPLLGMSFFQLSQFLHKNASHILVLAQGALPDAPALIEGQHFSPALFDTDDGRNLLEVQVLQFADRSKESRDLSAEEYAQQAVRLKVYDAVVLFPPDFVEKLARRRTNAGTEEQDKVPFPDIIHNSAQEKSQFAYIRVNEVMNRWMDLIGKESLERQHVSPESIRPFQIHSTDVADEGHKDAAIWSKILPFVLMIWALTGAFYPAVDLCAGEKERGTLETLLSSPARRSEIVCGKLLTVMTFSMATSLLNLTFMAVTGLFIIQQVGSAAHGALSLGPPPITSALWMLVALVPISAFFSALCLAVAAFARSTKEGQYYLMPLILIIMPLMVLPMTPGVELDLGKSLIPVTGVVLLLRAALEGNSVQAIPFIAPVTIVTLIACWLAIRWAVDQFNKESVLFREGERLDVGMWLRRLVRDREDTPSPAEAIFCGIMILTIKFILDLRFSAVQTGVLTFDTFTVMVLVLQLTAILTPALLMAVMLTGRPDRTLLLKWPRWLSLPAVVVLAVALNPLLGLLQKVVVALYPVTMLPELEQLTKAISSGTVWQGILLIAVVPAICEELAFRGFILSGLRRTGGKWRAIILTAIFFGVTHSIVQQSLLATLTGCVIGYIAIQTGSIVPCMLFHFTNNALTVALSSTTVDWNSISATASAWHCGWLATFAQEGWGLLFQIDKQGESEYTLIAQILGAVVAAALLYWLSRQRYVHTKEETHRETVRDLAAAEART
jgi:sodium transport system permease protein